MMSKYSRKILALLLGFIFLLGGLVTLELIARYMEKNVADDKNIFNRLGVKFNQSTFKALELKNRQVNPPEIGSWSFQKKNYASADCSTSSKLKESQGDSMADRIYSYDSFTKINGVLRLLPNIKNPHSRFSIGEKLIYDKSYSTDNFGRRKTIEHHLNPGHFLVFLGGSFIFGEGVNDDETLPSLVSQELHSVASYNYGTPGAGLGAVYAQSLSRQFREEIKEKDGIVLFFYFDFDLLRSIPTFSQGSQEYMKEQPFFEEENNKIKLVSPERFEIKNKLAFYRLLSKSAIVRSLHIDFPTPNESHFKLYAKAVEALREKMIADLGVKKFYVVALPDSSYMYFDKVAPYLKASNFNVLDFSLIRLENILTTRPYYECDGHPTVDHNKFMASKIAESLKGELASIKKN